MIILITLQFPHVNSQSLEVDAIKKPMMLLGTYTINDEVVYSIGIEELKDGVWGPYAGTDVQMEFVRIDPFVRTTLKNHNGNFKAEFTIPDVYGVYQFKVSFALPKVFFWFIKKEGILYVLLRFVLGDGNFGLFDLD